MLKKLLLAAALVVPMCLSAQSKFGYVSSIEIFNLMPEKATAEKSLQEVGQKYDTEFKALQDEFNKKFGEYQALAQDTPASIKERREQELQELQTKIQNFQQVAGQDLQRQQQILMAPIQEKIQTAIQSVGAENGFTFIFDSSTFLYHGADAVDVTPMVKAKLNLKDAPAAATTGAVANTEATTTK